LDPNLHAPFGIDQYAAMSAKTILLIEDNPSDVDLTRRALEKGHIANQLVVIQDGQDALDYLNAAESPALALLDLKLPRVQGLEVLRWIRGNARLKRLPVVVLTSTNEEEDVLTSDELGVNSYIRKPVDFDQFARAVEHLGLYWLVLNDTPFQASSG
jgi:two-component system response regulator